VSDLRYDPAQIAGFFDEYGEREWERLEGTPWGRVEGEVHRRLLREFVRPGDRVLEVGAGPGRFTLELARLGARVVVTDVSPRQLELHREKTAEVEQAVEERSIVDIVDLSRFEDAQFDAAVCVGGPLSYVLERADDAVGELLRVTRPGGHVVVSVMSLLGATRAFGRHFPALIERFGWERAVGGVFATGLLDGELNNGHVLRLYRWSELQALLERHPCRVVAATATNYLSAGNEDFTVGERWLEIELAACREPGALDGGTHITAVVEKR
jgi:ubiquinone/menaquinone biosynthesis C-methylase UbiE